MTTVETHACTDRMIIDQWHPLAALEETEPGVVHQVMLLEEQVSFAVTGSGVPSAWLSDLSATGPVGRQRIDARSVPDPLPVMARYGYLWTSLGSPPDELFEIPEYYEPDRRNLNAATIGLHVSAPRAVENFLDMGHFPFVHTDILGVEPHTEVVEYDVEIAPDTNEIWATKCFFYQPVAAASSESGQMSEYVYRVPHPYCVFLYKSCPSDETRMDVIGLLVRSVTATQIEASMLVSIVDPHSSIPAIRRFQQTVFGQDKPILENQSPKRLPLDPRAETPIRADKVAIVYRRWLSSLGVTYGVIPAEM